MLPLVVPFGRVPRMRPVLTVATVLDDPDRPATVLLVPASPGGRCQRCHRRAARLVDGLGVTCHRRVRGRTRRGRARRPANVDHQGPDLLDLLRAAIDNAIEAGRP